MSLPFLLSRNPELQRNIWLELSLTRLIAMPLIIAIILGIIYEIKDVTDVQAGATAILYALLILWGTRLAVDAYSEEVAANTWDLQRLSANNPLAFALGKLFGSTIYVWYGAIFCIVFLLTRDGGGVIALKAIIAGFTAQGAALFAALARQRAGFAKRRAQSFIAQIFGILVGVGFYQSNLIANGSRFNLDLGQMSGRHSNIPVNPELMGFYGAHFDAENFVLATTTISGIWFVVGIYRIIRSELGYRQGPTFWSLFCLYSLLLNLGMQPPIATANGFGVFMATLTMMSLSYIAIIYSPLSLPLLRRLVRMARSRRPREIWREIPVWVPSVILAVVMLALVSPIWGSSLRDAKVPLIALSLPFLGFFCRDMALIILLRLSFSHRVLLLIVIIFAVLYGLLPALFNSVQSPLLSAAFLPLSDFSLISFVSSWAQFTIVMVLLWWRWNAKWRLAVIDQPVPA